MGKFFSRITSAGSLGAIIITWATAGWGVILSAVLATVVWTWSGLAAWIETPVVQACGYVFLFSLWTYIGLSTIRARQFPQIVRNLPDYRYGLTIEGFFANIDFMSDEQWLGFGFQLRNFSQNPIRYTIKVMDIRIGTRAMPRLSKIITGYLARGAGRTSSGIPFSKDDVKEFFGKRVNGTVEAVILYGSPERPPERMLTVRLNITLGFLENGLPPLSFGNEIIGEEDTQINNG